MFKTLYGRLAAALIGLLCLLGAAYTAITLYATRLHMQEVNQNLNQTLAHNLLAERPLFENGNLDRRALEQLFHTFMVVNPSIEVYLLDPQGRILGYSAPPGKIKADRIDLDPVRRFLGGSSNLPITGDDPRNPEQRKVFSAAPIGNQNQPQGYLYIVLTGEHYNSTAHMLERSHVLRLGAWSLAGALVVGALVGLLLFYRLTLRLRRLDASVSAFETQGPEEFHPGHPPDSADDELGRLERSFHRMAEHIGDQVHALKRNDALRRELVANVSHDLRTPITSLQGYLETLLLKENELSQERKREYLQVAIRHSQRLSKLVAELFELAKLESGQTQLQREPFSLGDLVQDVTMKFRLQAEQRGVELQTRIPWQLPLVSGDIALIERVLDNLLDNALQHTPEGGTVEVILEPRPQVVAVRVADTGCGIPAKELEQVFDRFYQVARSENDTSGGAGLGLAIAKRILDLHSAPIQVDSAPDCGTRFDFSLPAAV